MLYASTADAVDALDDLQDCSDFYIGEILVDAKSGKAAATFAEALSDVDHHLAVLFGYAPNTIMGLPMMIQGRLQRTLHGALRAIRAELEQADRSDVDAMASALARLEIRVGRIMDRLASARWYREAAAFCDRQCVGNDPWSWPALPLTEEEAARI